MTPEFICSIEVLIEGRSVAELWDIAVRAMAEVEITGQIGVLTREVKPENRVAAEGEILERDMTLYEVLARGVRMEPSVMDPKWLTSDLGVYWFVDSTSEALVNLDFQLQRNKVEIGLVWNAELLSSSAVVQARQLIAFVDKLWDAGLHVYDGFVATARAKFGGKRALFGEVDPPFIRHCFVSVGDAAQLEQRYVEPGIVRELGLVRREPRDGRAYLAHTPCADDWFQWITAMRRTNVVLARAAVANATTHHCDWGFNDDLLPELRDDYYRGAHHLSFGSYDPETYTLSYVARCAGPDDHLNIWEIHTLGRLLRNAASLVDLRIDAVRVEFDDMDAAMRERRPLLDVGVQVVGPPDADGIPQPIGWPVLPRKVVTTSAPASRKLCLEISSAGAESLEGMRDVLCRRLSDAVWRPEAVREQSILARSGEVAEQLRLPDPRPPQPARRWSGDLGPFALQIDAFESERGVDMTLTTEAVTADDAEFGRCLAGLTRVLEELIDEVERGSVSRSLSSPPCMPVPPLFRRSHACIVPAAELSRWYRDPDAVERMSWQRWRRHNDKLFVARHLDVVDDREWFAAFFEQQWSLAKAAKQRQFGYNARWALSEEEAEFLAAGWTGWSLEPRVENRWIEGLEVGAQVTAISGAEIQAWMQVWHDHRPPSYASSQPRFRPQAVPEVCFASREIAMREGPAFAHLGVRVIFRAADGSVQQLDEEPPS